MTLAGLTLACACLGSLACDRLFLEPTAIDVPVQFAVSDFDTIQVAPHLERVDRVRMRLTTTERTREVFAIVTTSRGVATTRVALEHQELVGDLRVDAELIAGAVALFRGGATISTDRTVAPVGTISVTPIAADIVSAATRGIEFTALGDSATLEAVVIFFDGEPIPGAVVEWTADDPRIVSVTPAGLLRPLANGRTDVLAEYADLQRIAPITVAQIPDKISAVEPADTTVFVGDSFLARPVGVDRTGFPLLPRPRVDWLSSGVVTIDSSGVVVATAPGSGTFSASLGAVVRSGRVTVLSR